jgi:hypothetical protein
MTEKEDIVSWCYKYFVQIKMFREGNKSIMYTDKSCVSTGHIVQDSSLV